MLYGGDLCKREIYSGVLCKHHAMALIWKFDIDKVSENKANADHATEKQIKYMEGLLESFARAGELVLAIQAFNQWPVTVRDYTKGEAMYFIKCARGEIKPKAIQ